VSLSCADTVFKQGPCAPHVHLYVVRECLQHTCKYIYICAYAYIHMCTYTHTNVYLTKAYVLRSPKLAYREAVLYMQVD